MASQTHDTYVVVNGALVKKAVIQIETFPDLEDYLRMLVTILENVYTLALEKGRISANQEIINGGDIQTCKEADISTPEH